MGQNEEPPADVWRANFSRREHARCDLVAQALKLSGDFGKAQGEVSFDVFDEHSARPDLVDDPSDLGPQVARIIRAPALAGCREGLAGIAGKEDMNAATPNAAVEGSQVIPDRRLRKCSVLHPRGKRRGGVEVVLDVADGPIVGLGDMEPKVESAIA